MQKITLGCWQQLTDVNRLSYSRRNYQIKPNFTEKSQICKPVIAKYVAKSSQTLSLSKDLIELVESYHFERWKELQTENLWSKKEMTGALLSCVKFNWKFHRVVSSRGLLISVCFVLIRDIFKIRGTAYSRYTASSCTDLAV